MQGVSSALIARNESWVRQQAGALIRRLPANVERADLIQVGLIAVAQAALGFVWEGDAESDAGKLAFVRYAQMRVKGAMLDELRQLDHLSRADRRKVNVIRIARDRWKARHGANASLGDLSAICDMSIDEIAQLEQVALAAQTQSLSEDPDSEDRPSLREPATAQDEVEARVDTAIVLRRLEKFFATLPDRERQVIDSYLGIGLTPVELAGSLKVSPSRVSQMYKTTVERITRHFSQQERASDRPRAHLPLQFNALVAAREKELALSKHAGPWGALVEKVLTMPEALLGGDEGGDALKIDDNTRWG
jgi:RNA polymerase sigma factor for flagellar operon FliA